MLYDLVKKGAYDMSTKQFLGHANSLLQQQVASSLLVCITDIFKYKIMLALEQHPHVKAVTFVGGVACNSYIKNALHALCDKYGLPVLYPFTTILHR